MDFTTVLTIVVIIVSIIALIWVFSSVDRKPKSNEPSAFYNKTPANYTIDNHNEAIKEWENVSIQIMTAMQKKRADAILKQDRGAIFAISSIIEEYNSNSDEVSNYLMRSNTCVDIRDYAGSGYCIKCVKEITEKTKLLVKAINDICVDDCVETMKVPTYKSTSMGFFDDCKNMDDIKVRYRALSKVFHPDNQGGSNDMFEELEKQYVNIIRNRGVKA